MITIKQPQQFMPSNSPVIFQWGSTFSNIIYFETKIYSYADGGLAQVLLSTEKSYVTPINKTGSVIDISQYTKSLTNEKLSFTTSNSVMYFTRELKIDTEEVGSNGGTVSYINTEGNEQYYVNVWEAELTRSELNNYKDYNYFYKGTTASQFLTSKPNYTSVTSNSVEYLYFGSSVNGTYSMAFTVFSSVGATVSTQSYDFSYPYAPYSPQDGRIFQLNVSPYKITGLQDGNSYSCVVKFEGVTASEVKYYKYEDVCVDKCNIFWANRLGGIDSYQFINPTDTLETERFDYKTYPYGYNSNMIWDTYSDGQYRPNTVTISTKKSQTINVWSKPLTDDEARWLADIIYSKKSWVETADGIYPIVIDEKTFKIGRNKYTRDDVVLVNLNFTIDGDFIDINNIVK